MFTDFNLCTWLISSGKERPPVLSIFYLEADEKDSTAAAFCTHSISGSNHNQLRLLC